MRTPISAVWSMNTKGMNPTIKPWTAELRQTSRSRGELSNRQRRAACQPLVCRAAILGGMLLNVPAIQATLRADDLDGWLRLTRAYTVLGELDNAIEALTRATALATRLPAGAPERKAIESARAALARDG